MLCRGEAHHAAAAAPLPPLDGPNGECRAHMKQVFCCHVMHSAILNVLVELWQPK